MPGDLKVFTVSATGALIPGIPSPPAFVTGIDKLVQLVALLMLSNGGRSIANPGRAGGLRQLIGMNFDPADPAELFADIRIMVNRTEQLLKEEQVRTNRPSAERLLTLQLIDVIPNEDELSVEIVVGVINEEQSLSQAVVAIR